jgi:hypothetical protein
MATKKEMLSLIKSADLLIDSSSNHIYALRGLGLNNIAINCEREIFAWKAKAKRIIIEEDSKKEI